jgi:NhaP-type Na+/H+ or K+/H+ antiporter
LGNSRQPGPGGAEQREQTAKSFFALVVCVVGILLGLAGFVTPSFTGSATTADVSILAVGILLGILGYYLGASRFAISTVALCIVAIFFGRAASQDLIPGIQGEDRDLPAKEPGVQRSDS